MDSIEDFFAGKSVFVTGGTGFMGKVLIEKLVRSFPRIDKIYMLIRPFKEKSVHDRLNEMIHIPLFQRVQQEQPGMLEKKLYPIQGDITQPELGISGEMLQLLQENVSIVFHAAATVRFDQPLQDAIIMNTRGTRDVVYLAKSFKHLSVFVHLSTTYCNCDRQIVDEVIYSAPVSWKEAIYVAENMDPVIFAILGDKYIGRFPNTYTLTKNLAEQLIADECGKMPVVIFRPSIVIATADEPVQGWIDNFNGPVGLLTGVGKGVIRTILTAKHNVADYMPVDIAIKAMIVAAWKHATLKNDSKKIIVYNGSSGSKSVSSNQIVEIGMELINEYPFLQTLWVPSINLTQNKTYFYISIMLKQVLPAFIIDSILFLIKQEPINLLRIQRKIYKASTALSYFTTQSWWFINDQFLNLVNEIPEGDKEAFDFNFQHRCPHEYFRNATIGASQYLLKSDMGQLPQAISRMKRLVWADRVLKAALLCAIIWWLYKAEYYPDMNQYL